jgi:hypothetical protein
MQTGTLWVGDPDVAGSLGLLELYGTTVTVTNWAQVYGGNGDIVTYVGDASCGLDLAEDATLTVGSGGLIHLVFNEWPTAGGDGHWGLRWGGMDKVADLQALVAAGRLTWDDAAVGGKVEIYAHKGASHVGVAPPRGTVVVLR